MMADDVLPEPPTASQVAQQLGSSWLGHVDGQELELELTSVEEAGGRPAQPGYVMDLRQAAGPPIPQMLVELTHPVLGTHQLFLVPQMSPESGEHWYAVTVS